MSAPRPLTRARPIKQARSRKTLDRLLDAAESVLEARGLEAATVPAIAERAGLSVGVVYRRFPDKDALMRAVYERFFTRVLELNRASLDPIRWGRVPLTVMTRAMITGMVQGYRAKRELLRSLILYAQTHRDARFRRDADKLNMETVRLVEALLLRHRRQIRHRHPERAIRFGLLLTAFLLRGMVQVDARRFERFAPPKEELTEELIRMFLGYLGVTEATRRPGSKARPMPRAGPGAGLAHWASGRRLG